MGQIEYESLMEQRVPEHRACLGHANKLWAMDNQRTVKLVLWLPRARCHMSVSSVQTKQTPLITGGEGYTCLTLVLKMVSLEVLLCL